MYEEITIDRSIFFIEQHHIDTYKIMASKMKDYSYILNEGSLNKDDAWMIAFNVWILLLPDDDIFFGLEEKSLYYTSIFLIYNAVKEDLHFQKLKQRGDSSPELFYLTSLYVATGIINWVSSVSEKYNLLHFNKMKFSRSYFDAPNGNEEEVKQFLALQSKCVKAFVRELKDDVFCHMIKKCCDDSYFLYVDKFLNQRV
ncbi:hypothetical protein D1B33_06580 [Lysinibacillus yapensis]|uniref:Uncharacterized protein n=2 Tax=Ureibacillus yapensis TaxID=2304605 RepID=A0A396SAZ8_9BACL|nr:hypothetical protein D1B33_06580 [Lysinibacillus yapensis]